MLGENRGEETQNQWSKNETAPGNPGGKTGKGDWAMRVEKRRTPRSRVRSALRLLWLRSRERSSALKREGYRCQDCGSKQSRAVGREVLLEVHHIDRIVEWERLIDQVYEQVLVEPDRLKVLCRECHQLEHGGKSNE